MNLADWRMSKLGENGITDFFYFSMVTTNVSHRSVMAWAWERVEDRDREEMRQTGGMNDRWRAAS
jgi:hypothetical protein